LAQARELEAKLEEEYHAVRLLRASIAGEASARGEHARELGRQDRDRINTGFNVDDPSTPPRASQKLISTTTLLRAIPAPSTPEVRNLHREAQALIEQAAVQQAKSSASHIRQQGSARDDGGAQGPEPSVHTGGAAERPANPGRTPAKERLLDTRGFHRVRGYDEGANQRAREDSLDQLDEARTMALMHSSRYHQSLRRYQAWKVRR
jgi:hypothetical protein